MRPKTLVAVVVLFSLGVLGATDAEARRGKRSRRAAPAIPALTAAGLPNVQAQGAIVIDRSSGAVLYEKDADHVRNIASTGKIFVAMVARRRGIDLEGVTEITEEDQRFARGGARTRMYVGHAFKNIDLMRAMLIASDNRACTAIGRAIGLTPEQLIAEMNELARELGLEKTRFSDPSGLRGNESTAREMAIALSVALEDPVLAEIMATAEVVVDSIHARPHRIHYRNTNRSLSSARHEVIGGKTGYTDAAGYCLIIAARFEGRDVLMTFLGAHGKLTRYGDFNRVAGWITSGSAPSVNTATLAPQPVQAGAL